MDILEIRKFPIRIDIDKIKSDMSTGLRAYHESILRSYQILGQVKYYLKENVPANIILELIETMERGDE
jgi:hypothetical protein